MERSSGRAAPITTVIGRRVRTLRDEAHLSGTALAAEMVKRGVSWNRSTVAKLETGQRESVTVQELLALALVLDVPPVWLMADPTRAGGDVPLAPGIDFDPWTALLWMAGREPIGKDLDRWTKVDKSLQQADDVIRLVGALAGRLHRRVIEAQVVADYDSSANADSDRRTLVKIVSMLTDLDQAGFQLPLLPTDVIDRAAELGVTLPARPPQDES